MPLDSEHSAAGRSPEAGLAQVRAFAQALTALQADLGGTAVFARHWRTAMPDAVAALPPRYTEVLLGLMDRLESSALFADESCSFSHSELLASLRLWADKAQGQLALKPQAPV
jgi:hypothetical protein